MFVACTYAGLHVHGGHKSIVAEAVVLSGDVGALSTIAYLRLLLTLIHIWTDRYTDAEGKHEGGGRHDMEGKQIRKVGGRLGMEEGESRRRGGREGGRRRARTGLRERDMSGHEG